MNDRRGDTEHPEDLPWNDVPGDSSVIAGTDEPAPAEVVGADGHERDLSVARDRSHGDRNRRDTLAERLAEEEPEARLRDPADPEVELQGPLRGGGDVVQGEQHDKKRSTRDDERPAEEAAIHIRQR